MGLALATTRDVRVRAFEAALCALGARLVLPAVVLRVARNLAAPAEVTREEGLLFWLLLPTPPTARRALVVVVVTSPVAISSATVALRL